MNLTHQNNDFRVFWLPGETSARRGLAVEDTSKSDLLAVWTRERNGVRHDVKVCAVQDGGLECVGIMRKGRRFSLHRALPGGFNELAIIPTMDTGLPDEEGILMLETDVDLLPQRQARNGAVSYGVREVDRDRSQRLEAFDRSGDKILEAEMLASNGGVRAWAAYSSRSKKNTIGPASEPNALGSDGSLAVRIDFIWRELEAPGGGFNHALVLRVTVPSGLNGSPKLKLWRYHPQVERMPCLLTLTMRDGAQATNVELVAGARDEALFYWQGNVCHSGPEAIYEGRMAEVEEMDMFIPMLVDEDDESVPVRILLSGEAQTDCGAVRFADGNLMAVPAGSPSFDRARGLIRDHARPHGEMGDEQSRDMSLTPDYLLEESSPGVKKAVTSMQGALLALDSLEPDVARGMAKDIPFLAAVARVPMVFRRYVLEDFVKIWRSSARVYLPRVQALFERCPMLPTVLADCPQLGAAAVEHCEPHAHVQSFGLHSWLHRELNGSSELEQTLGDLTGQEVQLVLEALHVTTPRSTSEEVERCLRFRTLPSSASEIKALAAALAEVEQVASEARQAGDDSWANDVLNEATKRTEDQRLVQHFSSAADVRRWLDQVRAAWDANRNEREQASQQQQQAAAEQAMEESKAQLEHDVMALTHRLGTILLEKGIALLGDLNERITAIIAEARHLALISEDWPPGIADIVRLREERAKLNAELDGLISAAQKVGDRVIAKLLSRLQVEVPGLAVAASGQYLRVWLKGVLDRTSALPVVELKGLPGGLRSGLATGNLRTLVDPKLLTTAVRLADMVTGRDQVDADINEVRRHLASAAQDMNLPLLHGGGPVGSGLAEWVANASAWLKAEFEKLDERVPQWRALCQPPLPTVLQHFEGSAEVLAEWKLAGDTAATQPRRAAKMLGRVANDRLAERIELLRLGEELEGAPPEPRFRPAQHSVMLDILSPVNPSISSSHPKQQGAESLPTLPEPVPNTPAAGAAPSPQSQVMLHLQQELQRWVGNDARSVVPRHLAVVDISGMGLSESDVEYPATQRLMLWAQRAEAAVSTGQGNEDVLLAELAVLEAADGASLRAAGLKIRQRFEQVRRDTKFAAQSLCCQLPGLSDYTKDWTLDDLARAQAIIEAHRSADS